MAEPNGSRRRASNQATGAGGVTPGRPRVRFTLWRLSIGVALLALVLTVIIQTVSLRSASVREQRLQAALAQMELLLRTAVLQKEWAEESAAWLTLQNSSATQKWAGVARRTSESFR